MARPRREAFSTPQLRQLGDVGRDAPGFGLSSHAAAFSLLPSVPRNGHRGSPSVQPPAAHFVQPVFGRFARCLIGGRPRGVGCCLCGNLGLLCKFALLVLPRFFTLRRALGSRGGNGLALLSSLDGGRPFDERHFEFCQHHASTSAGLSEA